MSDVRQNTTHHRFELDADGHKAVAYYRLGPGVITFTHTEVPQALSGRVLLRVPSHEAASLRPPGTRIGIALAGDAAVAFRAE